MYTPSSASLPQLSWLPALLFSVSMALLDSPRSITSWSSSCSSQGDVPLLPSSASSSPRLFPSPAQTGSTPARARTIALLGAGAMVCILLLAWNLPTSPDVTVVSAKSEKESLVSPARRSSSANEERGGGRGRKIAGVAELLLSTAPSKSIYDSLDPQLRYLIADSWSGLSGQITSAFALLYLAQQTQRIAILPSWHDDGHYGESIIRMSLLFDLDGLREATGLLYVELDDAKPQDPHHLSSTADEVGCFRASPWFDTPLALPDHNIHQSIITAPLPSSNPWSFEAFTLFDFDAPNRLRLAAEQAEKNGYELPRNVREEDPSPQGGGLLCYTNLWDLGHAGGGVRRVKQNGHYGNAGFSRADESKMAGLLDGGLSGVHPEWWHVGRFVDFTPAIWDIALSCVYETLGVDVLPPLVTVHLRRGDFLSWCPDQQKCTPPVEAYRSAVAPFLRLFNASIVPFLSSSPKPRVLVTTDETTDMDFLASIDALGWDRVNHTRLGTEEKLRAEYGEAWRWADSAVDQAILSLGQHFVGTRGSQVSQLSELRVATWNGGQTAIVDRRAS